MRAKPKKRHLTEKETRKIMGVTASIRNMMLAVAMLVAFIGTFFSIYNWSITTFASKTHLVKVEVENNYRWETTVLNSMYSRFYVLDNMVIMAGDLAKVPQEIRNEYNDLKAKIKMQEEKVKVLQERVCK